MQRHFTDQQLALPKGTIGLSNILWVILSHHAARHHATFLRKQLLKKGVKKELLLVKQGFRQGEAKDGARVVITYNEITMYSFLYRWLPAVAAFLTKPKQDVRCVVYLECTARCEFSHATRLLKVLNQYPDRPLKWLGYRKFHPPKPERNRHSNAVYEGSKLLACTGASLAHVRQQHLKNRRYGHFDLWLCRTLRPSYFWAPAQSMTSSCQHLSICGGDSEGPIIRDAEPAGRRPMKRRRNT